MLLRREMPRPLLADMLGRLAVALSAGIDVRRAWQMEVGMVPAAWRPRMERVSRSLAQGLPLSESLAAAEGTFPSLVLGMVAVGDRTGHEAETLRDLSRMLQQGVRTTRELRRALAGPAFQLAAAVGVVGFLIFMAGMMQTDILGLGLRGVAGLLKFLALVAGLAFAGRLLFARALASWRRHGIVRTIVDRLPVIGPASRAAEAATWCRAAALASGAGLDAGRLVTLASSVAPGLAVDAPALGERLRGGDSLAEALDRTRRFPRRLLEVIAVGEVTGNTSEVLDRLAGHLDDEARAGFEASARGAGFLVWASVAGLIVLVVFRIFSTYVGILQDAAGRITRVVLLAAALAGPVAVAGDVEPVAGTEPEADAAEAGADAGTETSVEAAPRRPTPQEVMTQRGLVRYRGSWRTVQEIELLERADRANLARKEWETRLERLRKKLDASNQSTTDTEEIREISDPFAVPALAAALAREPQPRVRACYVEALSHVRGPEALSALIVVALDHADPETRILAVERLITAGSDASVPALVAALGGADNERINRAAEALGRLGSSAAIGPLIEVLETEHLVTVAGGAPEGSTTATFTPSGGGLSMGSGPKRVKTRVRNQRVLEALVSLSGANFEWNLTAWRNWLASRQTPPDFDPRRG